MQNCAMLASWWLQDMSNSAQFFHPLETSYLQNVKWVLVRK